jgi:signal transduction histidine kinase
VISAIHVFGSSWLPAGAALVAVVVATTALGLYIRSRRELFDQLRDRAQRLQAERDQQATIAATAERTRIAREMHDIIAHHLTVMVALSEGAAAQTTTSPERAAAAMRTVSETGRQALSDTRRLLGVLRDADGAPARTPQPDSLDDLVERVRGAGLTVRYQEHGAPPAEPAVRLAVYRVVQEALTNTMRHGGQGATADVRVIYQPDEVRVDVTDDGGDARPQAPGPGAGRGLVGMRERFEALGGRLDSGPRAPRGWQVSGRIEVGRP